MEVEEFDEIEKLQHQGINAGDIKKLKEAGVHTIQGLQMIPRRVRSSHIDQDHNRQRRRQPSSHVLNQCELFAILKRLA